MGLMTYIHKLLLKRGKLNDLLPDIDDLDGDRSEREAARAEIASRVAYEKKMNREVKHAIERLQELNNINHYGESLRRAFGGK